MPGCDSDENPDVIASLRLFRFENKTPQYKPFSGCSKEYNSSLEKNSLQEDQNNIVLKKEIPDLDEKQPNSSPILEHKEYTTSTTAESILDSLLDKLEKVTEQKDQVLFPLSLTLEELQKLKGCIYKDRGISCKWRDHVYFERPNFEIPGETVIGINCSYSSEVLTLVENIASGSQHLSTEAQPKIAMDDYENFASKETSLRKLLDANPGADIMEAQDMLARCEWNLAKAMVLAQTQQLSPKPPTFLRTNNQNVHTQSKTLNSIPATEIVLSDSDDEVAPPSKMENKTYKRVRQISSSSSDGEVSQNTVSSSHSVVSSSKNIPYHSNHVQNVTSSTTNVKNSSLNLPKGLVFMQIEDSPHQDGAPKISIHTNGTATSSVSSNISSNLSVFQSIHSKADKSPNLIKVQANNASVSSSEVKMTAADSSTSKKPKAKRKKLELDDEDDDYGDDIVFDSDDSDYCDEVLTSAHSSILKFFQEATYEEMSCVPGCSKKKLDILMTLRPFSNWSDLVQKLSNDKTLSTDLLNSAKKVVDMRNAINKLMVKCQQISIEMEDLVENLKERKHEALSDYVDKQPDLLNDRMTLTPYQILGLNWMLLLHNQDVNGILADEMGLGKTVQAISFLAYLKEIMISGPHLIVAPSSTLENWKNEFETWWPNVSLIIYHGSQDSRRELRMRILNDEVDEFDVMITTYNMVTSSNEDRSFFKKLEFHYVVFDEAHMLKNMASQRYQNLMKIRAPRRLLLTGTPLQNNLVELMSLLIFAMPHMFSGKTEQIKLMFSSVSKAEGNKNAYERERIDHAKKIMKPFVLRRLKKDVLQDLPPKHDSINVCKMSESQAIKYAELVKKLSVEMARNREKAINTSGAGMMMQLRRAANHPLLLRECFGDDKLKKMSKAMLKEPTHCEANADLIFEDMSVMSDFELHKLCKNFKALNSYILPDEMILDSGKFQVLDTMLPDCIEKNHRILIFSQFTMVLDIVEEYMRLKKYKFIRLDGQVPVTERQQLINSFNSDPSIFIFLLSTRAGGLGINLTAADTVIIHDIDFNPYNDKQAEDRCHRVGQVKDVSVTRLISADTIEEGILKRAKEKLDLERDIHEVNDTEENDVASVAKLLNDALGLSNSKT